MKTIKRQGRQAFDAMIKITLTMMSTAKQPLFLYGTKNYCNLIKLLVLDGVCQSFADNYIVVTEIYTVRLLNRD